MRFIFKNSVCTSQKTQSTFDIRISWLRLLRDVITVYSGNRLRTLNHAYRDTLKWKLSTAMFNVAVSTMMRFGVSKMYNERARLETGVLVMLLMSQINRVNESKYG
jgi:hypothetical protein